MRRALILCLFLSGCAAGNTGFKIDASHDKIGLPSFAAPTVVESKPACPAELMADIPPEPPLPLGAGFPAAESPAASIAVQTYLGWLRSLAVWGRGNAARAQVAKTFCG